MKKFYCDKCGDELKGIDEWEDVFSEVQEAFDGRSRLLQPQICYKCDKGYNKIIKGTNKRIKSWLKEK